MEEQTVQDDGFWRDRAMQLQGALNSRIVVEQAKGMLRERFGLDAVGAFALMRSAARGNGMNLHRLAGAITASFETPEPIVWALARQPEIFTVRSREQRVQETEEFFRRLNEAMNAGLAGNGEAFFCECANPYCNVTIKLNRSDLEHLHSRNGYYAMLPGHQIPELETVILTRDDYVVTETLAKTG